MEKVVLQDWTYPDYEGEAKRIVEEGWWEDIARYFPEPTSAQIVEEQYKENPEAFVGQLTDIITSDYSFNEFFFHDQREMFGEILRERQPDYGYYVEKRGVPLEEIWQPDGNLYESFVHEVLYKTGFNGFIEMMVRGYVVEGTATKDQQALDITVDGTPFTLIPLDEVDALMQDAKENGGFLGYRCEWDEEGQLFVDEEAVGFRYPYDGGTEVDGPFLYTAEGPCDPQRMSARTWVAFADQESDLPPSGYYPLFECLEDVFRYHVLKDKSYTVEQKIIKAAKQSYHIVFPPEEGHPAWAEATDEVKLKFYFKHTLEKTKVVNMGALG